MFYICAISIFGISRKKLGILTTQINIWVEYQDYLQNLLNTNTNETLQEVERCLQKTKQLQKEIEQTSRTANWVAIITIIWFLLPVFDEIICYLLLHFNCGYNSVW